MINKRASEPFCFITSSILVEITGKKAHHLKELVNILKQIDDSSIFFHVHHTFREYTFAAGQYSNDFARWAAEDLEEATLAERLSAINIHDFTSIAGLRAQIIKIIEEHLSNVVEIRKAPMGREFYFLRSTSIIAPTPFKVWTLKEFSEALKQVGMRSLYYHFFDARLRLGHKTNDFSHWISFALELPKVAEKIERLDPYFMTMDQLRDKIIHICLGKELEAKKSGFNFTILAKKLLGQNK
ncbi:hypothetical protein COT42_06310 [Candidatus Saganbacteria bacterium CG08_land_8_20_14_0_20_45_16]|uniref:Uncharacterized protein n=1 Tax=Candidatus Saganbacteria bacterium CG08_land_8_20_14_0_20_45_16 TaxID=2014293 RepID=A0A2H0XY48_UNCSA|nr:MAG: hypothetical protein COT42_06310 [Candidatus Saganbacteria bacterium CG08_land_8_20_14_0_20_45_16]